MKTGYTSNRMIAQSWDLWREYIDPDATMTKAEFDEMTVEQRISLIEAAFDDDYDEETNPDGVDTYHSWDCQRDNA
jgi:hypothetical protein